MKALDHIRITAEAVRQFVRFSHSPVIPILLQYSSLIQKGSEDADNSPFYSRTTSWHFYNGNLEQDTMNAPVWSFMQPLTFHLSSDHILRKRCEQFDQETEKKAKKDTCDLTGRILHHIQDMSTPSHVIPVYHGQLIEDSFETYLNKEFLANTENLESISEAVQKNPEALRPEPDTTIHQLYTKTAEQTLLFLNLKNSSFEAKVNDTATRLPWSYFWSDKNTIHPKSYPTPCQFKGFGTFGPLGKHFGTTTPFEREGDIYLIARSIYDDFCRKLVQDMLINSIKALFILESRLERICR